MDLGGADQASLMDASKRHPLAQRLIENSEHFLGTPYAHSPLGEGQGKDSDPLIRFDAVDCQTFVEETMAMSLAKSFQELEPVLVQLRYAQEPTFDDRNHLMEAQWIPRNLEKGFLRDVTERIAGFGTVTAFKNITKATWRSQSARALGLSEDHQPLGTFALRIIPLARVMQLAQRIPSGTILVVVREDRPYKVSRVSHLGFVVHKGGRTYLRHATISAARVVDEELGTFLHRNSKYEKWKVVGVSLFQVLEPAPQNALGRAAPK
jgi:hypothetical protein